MEHNDPSFLRSWLTLLQRAGGAQPVADDVLTFQGSNQAEWKALNALAGFDHGLLAGLGDDDHAQYALLAGRAGGQTLIGGTAAGDDLTLRSTSNVAQGNIYFGAAARHTYDEVNDRWGFGTAAPAHPFHVAPNVTTGTRGVVIAPSVNIDINYLRAVVLSAYVESNNVGLGGISWNPVLRPGAAMSQIYGVIGTASVDRAVDDATSYNVTNFHVNHYYGELSALYSGTVSFLRTLYIGDAVISGAGTINTQQGLYIANLTAGVVANYGIYQVGVGNPNYFAGWVGIGALPSTNLHVYENNADVEPAFQIQQNSTGDAALKLRLTGGQVYSIGIDNSDLDKLKISGGADVGTTTRIELTTAGQLSFLGSAGNINLLSTGQIITFDAVAPLVVGIGALNAAHISLYTGGGELTIDSGGRGKIGGGSAVAGAILELASTTGALLLPRMTQAQRLAVAAANGMVVYDITNAAVYAYEGGAWVNL